MKPTNEEIERVMWNEDLLNILRNADKDQIIELLVKVFKAIGKDSTALVKAEIDKFLCVVISDYLKEKK
jgi:uncharacterized protein (UPF0297 family)